MVSSVSSAPKKVSTGFSKQKMPTQLRAASSTEPMTETVKYCISLPSWTALLPRLALKITLPPMPISNPRL